MDTVDLIIKSSTGFYNDLEVEGMTYPQMKMIDMGFWQVGFDLDTNKGIKNVH